MMYKLETLKKYILRKFDLGPSGFLNFKGRRKQTENNVVSLRKKIKFVTKLKICNK